MQAWRTRLHGSNLMLVTATVLAAAGPNAAGGARFGTADEPTVVASGQPILRTPQIVVHRYDDSGLAASLDVADVGLSVVKTPAGVFTAVSWPDAPLAGEFGGPALPVVRRLFAVPQGTAVDLLVDSGPSEVMDLAAAGYPQPVYPLQPPISLEAGRAERVAWRFDGGAYAADEFAPAERAAITPLGIVRGCRLYLLEVRPVAYNPVRGELLVWRRIDLSLSFAGEGARGSSLSFLPGLTRLLLNPPPPAPNPRGTGNYLIVVANTLAATISDFATAKTAAGYTVTTQTVAPGTSKETIRGDIQSWYDPDVPGYVLLVGDTDTIPAWVGQGDADAKTDLPYACMDGGDDWYFDVQLGRFSVRTASTLQDMIDKTLYVAGGVFDDPGYVERFAFMAGDDTESGAEPAHNWVIDTYMDAEGLESVKLYTRDGAHTPDVSDAFNTGCVMGVYYGHSWSDRWQDGPYFSHYDVRNLANQGKYPFIISLTCTVGNYASTSYEPCFAEEWVRVGDKGAAAIIASSDYIYYSDNPGWPETANTEKWLFEAIYHDGIREIGPAWQAAMLKLLEYYGADAPVTRDYFEMFNLLGDPSLGIPEPKVPLRVRPGYGLDSEGPRGGPFTPDNITYDLSNTHDYAIDYEVTQDPADWVTLSGDLAGQLLPGDTAQATVEINSNAENFSNGHYENVVYFTNLTDHVGDTTRTVALDVGVPEKVYEWTFDADPGWSAEGLWAFGQPTGGGGAHGGPDPTSGYTGSNVYGYNLDGDYENSMPERHLTSTPIDCTGLTKVTLKFWRWLGVERPSYDHAYVRASNDGANWVTVWENPSEIADAAWQFQELDISAIANDQPTVYLRWTMGPTDSSWQYCGWNIDDLEIWAVVPDQTIPGDLNGDGCVDQSDLGMLLSDWGCTAGDCPGDCDGDGDTDQADLGVLLAHWNEGCG